MPAEAPKPAVTICIPTRNHLPMLRQTLAALGRQTDLRLFQVVVCDDGSTDGSYEELQSLRPGFDLRWVQSGGRGSGAARNVAAAAAEGEVLIFLDDDQLANPNLVAAHLAVQRREGPALVQGPYPLAPGCDRAGTSLVYQQGQDVTLWKLVRPGLLARHVWGANLSVTAATWREVGGFDETLLRNQDLDFGIRVSALGVPLVFEPAAFSHHLHRLSRAGFRRQEFQTGRDLVRIAQKHGLALEALLGPGRGLADRLAVLAWARAPAVADRAGRLLSGSLALADASNVRTAQLITARLLRRFYLMGGVTAETRDSAIPPQLA